MISASERLTPTYVRSCGLLRVHSAFPRLSNLAWDAMLTTPRRMGEQNACVMGTSKYVVRLIYTRVFLLLEQKQLKWGSSGSV